MRYLCLAVVIVISVFSIYGSAFGAVSFEVKDGKALITEVLTNQPVQGMGPNNQAVNIPGTTRNIETKIEVTKEQAQTQLVQLTTHRNNLTRNYNTQIAAIDEQINLLKAIDTALPAVVVEPVE